MERRYSVLDEKTELEIQKLASTFFSEEEIMEILEVKELTSDMKRAIRKYKLKSEADTRAAVFEQALAGSSPAQTLAIKIIEADKRKEY
ncbi:hypothetical protein [Mongoliibacter ruber]|uniref:Uncharacterized protein n=1 Tax=Mongoliibacter ruber TaxID=1750599 RepID=A0A2T0WV81_9BACT|nr:hypothetical protein [Mongoliibacter ruber]PRY90579.1 hypothetical protein CLW00_101242 [Mongoliibacter ruber]